MRLQVKKLDVADLEQLQSLVIEHLDEIEAGLTVLDSRLLLGHATVDIVALDAEGTLVLTTVGFTADEDMLLKAVEAYSWCMEYPDAIRRLYPSAEVSAARPPRLMFIIERMPDAFHRKVKQLGFSEVDCVEIRHLDVSGTPVAYFDTIARLRRGGAIATETARAPMAHRVETSGADKVVPIAAPVPTRATSMRLQKLLNTTGAAHGAGNVAAAPVIEMAPRTAAAPAPRPEPAPVEPPAPRAEIEPAPVEPPAPRLEPVRVEAVAPAPAPQIVAPAPAPAVVADPIERVMLREALAAPAPVESPVAVAPPAPASVPEPRVSFAEIAKELLGAAAAPPRAEVPSVIPRPPVEEMTRAALEDIAASVAAEIQETDGAVALAEPPAEMPIEAVMPEPAPVSEPVVARPEPVVAAAPAPAAAPEPAAAPAPATPSLPQEFNGLKFPNDGVLTRQWMEFLNQMAASK